MHFILLQLAFAEGLAFAGLLSIFSLSYVAVTEGRKIHDTSHGLVAFAGRKVLAIGEASSARNLLEVSVVNNNSFTITVALSSHR